MLTGSMPTSSTTTGTDNTGQAPVNSGGHTSRRNSQEISQSNDRIAATFLDAIKSAWLLNEIGNSQYERVNVLLQQVILGVRKVRIIYSHLC